VPRDAVCGVPADYADAIIDNTLSLLATITTVDEITAVWDD
jgi:biuret amidohydrolase